MTHSMRHLRAVLLSALVLALLLAAGLAATASAAGDGPWLVVANYGCNPDNSPDGYAPPTIHTVDTSTNTVYGPFLAEQLGAPLDPDPEGEIANDCGWLLDVAITPDCGTALVANFSDYRVFVIDLHDPTAPTLLGSVVLSATIDAPDPSVAQSAADLAASVQTGSLPAEPSPTALTPAGAAALRTIYVFPEDIALTADGQYAVACDGGLNTPLALIHVPTRSLVELFPLPQVVITYPGDTEPTDVQAAATAVTIAPNGTVIVADHAGELLHTLTIDGAGHLSYANTYVLPRAVVEGVEYEYPGPPINVSVAPDGQTVLVNNAFYPWLHVYTTPAPGVLVYQSVVQLVDGLTKAELDYYRRGGSQSLTFNLEGTRAYAIRAALRSSSGVGLPNVVAVLRISGPGLVSLIDVSAAVLPNSSDTMFFGVDTIAESSNTLYVSNHTHHSTVDYLSLVGLEGFDVSTLSAGLMPMGVAACGTASGTHVAGFAYHDDNDNGTLDWPCRDGDISPAGCEPGIPGAIATLNAWSYTTNTSGWWSFDPLDPGDYHVTIDDGGPYWTPTGVTSCDRTVGAEWDQGFCNAGFWWGLNYPLPAAVAAQTMAFEPIQDTFISAWEPADHGAEVHLNVRQPGVASTLLQFDTSALPTGAVPVWAKIRLYAPSASNSTNRLYLAAYPLTRAWTEAAATWQLADAAGWTAPGAVADTAPAVGWGWAGQPGWVEIDLDVNSLPAAGYGYLIRGEGPAARKVAYSFFSREFANAAIHPSLVIGYNLP